jgi:hypothetical protein
MQISTPIHSGATSTVPGDEVSLTITFSLSTYKELEDLSEGGTISEALRDAIALSKWFNTALKVGDKIFVKRKGKLHEVVKI